MTTYNQTNFNITTINGLSNENDLLSNITINESIKISNSLVHSNAALYIKDTNSNISLPGIFNKITSNSSTGQQELLFNDNIILNTQNALSELEQLYSIYTAEFSNIAITGGYINFFNGSNVNTNQGSNGVGLRYSANNTVQFKNADTDWIDLSDITKHDQFSELNDVDVYTNPLLNNQYITYNATSNLFVNSNLAIIHDKNPTLGGDLYCGNNDIYFSNITNNIYDASNVPLIKLVSNTTSSGIGNYLEINNSDTGSDPSIIARGTDSDIGILLQTKGSSGVNMLLNSSQGSIDLNSDYIDISGFVKNSIYRSSNKPGGYTSNTTWNIPITNDTILFDFTNSTAVGTYWANVSAGIDGQKLNLIYNNSGSNAVSVLVDFGTNGLLCGTGTANGIVFNTTGQSSMLVYLDSGITKWQILGTGAIIY